MCDHFGYLVQARLRVAEATGKVEALRQACTTGRRRQQELRSQVREKEHIGQR